MIVGPATLITGGLEPQVLPGAGLRVVGAHVAALGPFADVSLAFPDDPVWDTGHRVVVPGFVDALRLPHAALAVGLAEYAGIEGTLAAVERELDADGWAAATRATLVAGLKQGVTTAFLVCPAHGAGAEGLAAVVVAAQETKVRACIAGAVTDRFGPARAAELLDESAALVERAKKGWGDRLRALFGVATLAEVGDATLAAVAERARAAGAGVYLHAGLDEEDARDAVARHGTTPAGRLMRAGLFDRSTVVGPARGWPEPDAALLAAGGAIWASTPRADVAERGASFDYVTLAARGLVPATGAGDRVPHPLGEAATMFEAARRAGHGAREAARVAAQALFERGPELAQRHFVPGLGNLLPGSPADLVVLDAYPATPLGPDNWMDHLVQGLGAARVQSVMVAGEVLVADGRATVLDEREVQRQARAAVHRLWPRVAQSARPSRSDDRRAGP
jgi:5-methylthioadenosine/S-adenosylhomocysteine deaminase